MSVVGPITARIQTFGQLEEGPGVAPKIKNVEDGFGVSREKEEAPEDQGEEEEEDSMKSQSRDQNIGGFTGHSSKIQITDDDSRDFIIIYGYKINGKKNFLCKLGYLLTLGLLRLLFHWKPEWHVKAICDQCSLKTADQVFIRDSNQETYLRKVFRLINPINVKNGLNLILFDGSDVNLHTIRYFTLKKMKFLWYPADRHSPDREGFHRILDLDQNLPLGLYHRLASGSGNFELLDDVKIKNRAVVHGPNEVMVKLVPIYMLLFKEVLSPFYCFQAFSVTVWYCELYYIYATIIILISLVSVTLNIYLTRKNQRTLHEMMYSIDNVKVLRKNAPDRGLTVKEISSKELVVGDILLIPSDGCTMECDAVLLSGSCVVDESMLTGESTPCTKVPLPDDETQFYSTKQHQSHTLFCGTKILLAKTDFTKKSEKDALIPAGYVKSIVIRIGYNTSKGRLVRSILYPKPIDFAFTKDLFMFVGILSFVSLAGFLYAIVLMGIRGHGVKYMLIKSLDVVTIVVPPFLPAAMTIGIINAERRLRKKGIFCISPSTINTCGAVNCVCFDKTGTLTENGLDLMGVLPAEKLGVSATLNDCSQLDPHCPLLTAMACCHSLTTVKGQLMGDPMDLIIYKNSGYTMSERSDSRDGRRTEDSGVVFKSFDPDGPVVRPLATFPFNSKLKRMSTLVKIADETTGRESLTLFCKGAPEVVAPLCRRDTVPQGHGPVLDFYAKRGYRVISVAYKNLKNEESGQDRQKLESQMIFCGLIIFENRLKSSSRFVISELNTAKIRCAMITGDNLMTAVCVANQCQILDEKKPTYIVRYDPTMDRIDEDEKDENLNETFDAQKSLSFQKWSSNDDRRMSLTLTTAGRKMSFAGCSQDVEIDVENPPCWPASSWNEKSYQLAVEGSTLRLMTENCSSEILSKLYAVCDVYARMSPEQKIQVMHGLQSLDHVVAMCGDGANDCGALKAAHAGVSLSEAEASIASPFTSKKADVTCVPALVAEGRCALVTSFGIFKYMVCYSLTQFLSVSLLYWIGTTLDDFQFLYIDLFLTTNLMVFFGFTAPCSRLSARSPPTRLLCYQSFLSIGLQMGLVFVVQIAVYNFVPLQPWFVPFVDPGDEKNNASYQGTALFVVSLYQYMSLMLVYSKSHPFRRTVLSNPLLTASFLICISTSIWLSVDPPDVFQFLMSMQLSPSHKFRWFLVLMGIFDLLIALFLEDVFLDGLSYVRSYRRDEKRKFVEKDNCDKRTGPKYSQLSLSSGKHPSTFFQ